MESISVVAIDKEGNYKHFYSYSDAMKTLFNLDDKKVDDKLSKLREVCDADKGRKSYLGYYFIPTGHIPEENQKKISHNNIPVVAYNDEFDLLYFDSFQQASELTNLHESAIFKCVQGISKRTKNMIWKKAEEFDFLDFFEKRYQYKMNKRREYQKKKDAFFVRRYTEQETILELDATTMKFLREYENLEEAKKERPDHEVEAVVYGSNTSSKNYTWICKTDFCFLCCCFPSLVRWIVFNFNDELFSKYYNLQKRKKLTRISPEYKIKHGLVSPIGQYDIDGNLVKVYDHYFDYSMQFGLGFSTKKLDYLKNAIKKGVPYKGFIWKFLDKSFVDTPEYKKLKEVDVSTLDFRHHTSQKIYKKFKK